MLQPTSNGRPVNIELKLPLAASTLQLLLFIDDRPSSQERTEKIDRYLQHLKAEHAFEFQAIEVKERPDLVEHFRLIATPALVKLAPGPRQVLAGGDLVAQVQKNWSQWQAEIAEKIRRSESENFTSDEGMYSLQSLQLTEEIFRLKRDQEELLEQLQFKDRALAMLAHDLRSPLTAALIAVETLEMARDNPEYPTELVDRLCEQAKAQLKSMNRMITDILQAAQGKAGALKIKIQALYLPTLCEEVLEELQNKLRQKNLSLEQDIPKDIPPVYADLELIRQVLVNLLENAIKYTPEGGQISISILHRTTQKVQIAVCDTGPGIPEEKRERIFEGHFRLKRDQEKDGYGIGLSLCRQIVRSHYGQIWVDSIPEQGSCFHFTLPIHQ